VPFVLPADEVNYLAKIISVTLRSGAFLGRVALEIDNVLCEASNRGQDATFIFANNGHSAIRTPSSKRTNHRWQLRDDPNRVRVRHSLKQFGCIRENSIARKCGVPADEPGLCHRYYPCSLRATLGRMCI
jgi:hypothetical protein